MRTHLAPLAFVVSLGFAGAANADTAVGTIADIDTIQGTVTLSDGLLYEFEEDNRDALTSFGEGDNVTIEFAAAGDANVATAISPHTNGANTLTGIIQMTDPEAGTVTLANGMLLKFPDRDVERLNNFAVGDVVEIQYTTASGGIEAIEISPSNATANVASGTIAEVSHVTGVLVFADGTEFDFQDGDQDILQSFKPGDQVAIQFVTVGDEDVPLSISPEG